MGDFYCPESGRLLEVHEMPPEAQARLSSIKVLREKTHTTTDGVTETSVADALVELKTWDKAQELGAAGEAPGQSSAWATGLDEAHTS